MQSAKEMISQEHSTISIFSPQKKGDRQIDNLIFQLQSRRISTRQLIFEDFRNDLKEQIQSKLKSLYFKEIL